MSMVKIDMNSKEFIERMEKTVKFTDKVIKQFGWEYNPQKEVNEGVQMGLARNKMMYNKLFCPCFMVEEVDGKPQSVDNRICPCTPAIEEEIPNHGSCHCGIFCTPKFAEEKRAELGIAQNEKSSVNMLSKEECEALFNDFEISSENAIALLKARELGITDFKLIDVREYAEWQANHIKGTDLLIPTSDFKQMLENAKLDKDENLLIYCLSGQRSLIVAHNMSKMGYKKIGHLTDGLASFSGQKEQG